MIRSVLAAVKKADETFALIDPGDVICLGVSGGKDSLCLLLALQRYGLFSKKDFRIVPVCLDLGFPGFDPSPVAEYCKTLGLELNVSDSKEVYPILLRNTKPGHHVPCSICSRMKKAAINDVAKKLGCNKVAFAHHRDDALETLLMNMVHGGSVSTFEPKMRLDRAGIDFIRPLIFASEEQLTQMAEEEGLPVLGKVCPADGYTERQWCKDQLSALYQARPEAKANLASMLYDFESFRLYFDHVEYPNPYNPHLSLKPLLSAKDAIAYATHALAHGLSPLKEDETHYLILKDHKIRGCLSYVSSPHRIDVEALESDLALEETLAALSHFEEHESRKVNPLLFVLRFNAEEIGEKAGYHKGESPFQDYFIKRISR